MKTQKKIQPKLFQILFWFLFVVIPVMVFTDAVSFASKSFGAMRFITAILPWTALTTYLLLGFLLAGVVFQYAINRSAQQSLKYFVAGFAVIGLDLLGLMLSYGLIPGVSTLPLILPDLIFLVLLLGPRCLVLIPYRRINIIIKESGSVHGHSNY